MDEYLSWESAALITRNCWFNSTKGVFFWTISKTFKGNIVLSEYSDVFVNHTLPLVLSPSRLDAK